MIRKVANDRKTKEKGWAEWQVVNNYVSTLTGTL